MCTYLWLPILYTYLILVTCSIHKGIFKGLICSRSPPCLTYFLQVPPLWYTSDLYGLFCLFSSPLWANLHSKILWLNARITGDLFCTHILLVTYSVSHTHLTAHSLHIPMVTYCFYTSEFISLWRIFSWHILCISYFVYWLLLRELYLRDISWVHVHVPLMSYSVLLHFRRRILYTYLISIINTTSWPSLYTSDIIAYFLYLFLLVELIII